jgi:hypothetical protein
MNYTTTMNRAIRAYFRRFGIGAAQPSSALSHISDRTIVLSNSRGELARYRIRPRTGALLFVASS